MIKKMNILNFGIIAFFIALMFVGMPVEANEDNGVLIPFNDGTGGGIWVSEEELGPQPEQLTLSVEVDKDYYVPGDTVIVSGQLWGEEGGKEGMTVHVAIPTETFQTTTIAGAYEVKFPLPLDFPIGGVGITALVNQDYKAYKCDMKHAHFEVFETSFQATDCYLTGEPYTGIVGAGGNWLTFDVFLPKCSNVKVCNVGDGQVKDDVGNFITNLNLDSKGKAQFRYYPPEYPTPYSLSHQLDVHSSGPPVYAMEVPIVLTYSDGNGDDKTIETKIHVCRPPVMLVHGFLGASGTWAEMSAWLRGLKFDTFSGNYLIPGKSIQDLAEILKSDIHNYKRDYAKAGISLGQVDIVGHSMGGLIARFYVAGSPNYFNDVRKEIMVGTPNHGASWVDVQLGKFGASLYDVHKTPALQLYEESDFMKMLNWGEKAGNHLNPAVQ